MTRLLQSGCARFLKRHKFGIEQSVERDNKLTEILNSHRQTQTCVVAVKTKPPYRAAIYRDRENYKYRSTRPTA
jgi:hypothetical protein